MSDASGPGRAARWLRLIAADDALLLGLLALVLLLSVVLVHTPVQVYAANRDDFTISLASYVLLALGVLLVSLVAAAIPLVATRGAGRRAYAFGLTCLALVVWVTSSLVLLDFGLLDGRRWHVEFPAWMLILESVLLVLGAAAVVAGCWLRPRLMVRFLLLLNLGLAASTLYRGVAGPAPAGAVTELSDTRPLFRFSQTRNALIVLMDAFQADIFAELLAADPGLQKRLDGFIFFPDTLADAATTYLALPAIHSGRQYPETGPMRAYYEDAIRRRSFLNTLAAEGYEVALVNPVLGVCPERATLCVDMVVVLGKTFERMAPQAAQLLDISLFRAAPLLLKPLVYGDGAWLIGSLLPQGEEARQVVDSDRLVRELAARAFVEGDRPAAKFVHVFNTHGPEVLDEDCSFVGSGRAPSRGNIVGEAGCAVKTFSELIEALKEAGVYDQTLIVLLGDHGRAIESAFVADGWPRYWAAVIGHANPLLLVKPPGAHGPLRRSARPAQLSDVAATACATLQACAGWSETSLLDASAPEDRVRRFQHYVWRRAYWYSGIVPDVTRYEVRDPLWSLSSWPDAARRSSARYNLGQWLEFQVGGDAAAYQGRGWSEPEPWGTWTDGPEALLVLELDRPPEHDLVLTARIWAFAPGDSGLDVAVAANGEVIERWRFVDRHEAGETREARIPARLAALASPLRLAFRIANPRSPADLGPFADERRLGLGVTRARLDEAGPAVGHRGGPPHEPRQVRSPQ